MAQWQERFEALGIKVAAMSYDDVGILAKFHAEESLDFPLLRDVDTQHFSAYGVLNEEYEPGHRGYGIPHPGILFIDDDGKIAAKFAVPGYRERPPFEAIYQQLH